MTRMVRVHPTMWDQLREERVEYRARAETAEARVAKLEEDRSARIDAAHEFEATITDLSTRVANLDSRLRRVQRAARVLASHATWAIETCDVCGDGFYVVGLKRLVLTDCGRGVLACPRCYATQTGAALSIAPDELPTIRRCRVCGCTDDDCSGCIERTGGPCYWIEEDLCSACEVEVDPALFGLGGDEASAGDAS